MFSRFSSKKIMEFITREARRFFYYLLILFIKTKKNLKRIPFRKIFQSMMLGIIRFFYRLPGRARRFFNPRNIRRFYRNQLTWEKIFGSIKKLFAVKKFQRSLAIFVLAMFVFQYFFPILPFLPSIPLSPWKKRVVNADIEEAPANGNAMFVNVNPSFKVEFGDRSDTTQNRVRFEADPSKENPFGKEKSKNLTENTLEKIKKKVFPTEKGIEFSLVSTETEGELDVQKQEEIKNAPQNNDEPLINNENEELTEESDLEKVEETQSVEEAILEKMKQELSQSVENLEQVENKSEELTKMLTQAKEVFAKTELIEENGKKIVKNPEVAPGVDVKYEIIEGKGIKENIVVNRQDSFYEGCFENTDSNGAIDLKNINCSLPKNSYTFNLKLDPGVELHQAIGGVNKAPGGTYFFTDNKGNYLFHFLPLFAQDARAQKTNNVKMEITKIKQPEKPTIQEIGDEISNSQPSGEKYKKEVKNLFGKIAKAQITEASPAAAFPDPVDQAEATPTPAIPELVTPETEASSVQIQETEASSASEPQDSIIEPKEASSSQGFQELIGESQENVYQIKVIVDPNWLMDPVRTFPINIDPSIIHDTEVEFDAGDSLDRVESIAGPKVQINPAGGNDTNTVLLLHANGANNATTFRDSSNNDRTVTATGDAKISTTQSEFGGSSAYFDGSGDYLSVPESDDFDFGSGNFTIDWWEYRTASTSAGTSIQRRNTSRTPFMAGYSNGTNLYFYASADGSTWDLANAKSMGAITLNAWVHLAVVRNGSTFYTFKNGVQQDTWTSTLAMPNVSEPLEIGRYATNYYFPGYIDEMRISKGVARWTSAFTTPPNEYDYPKDYGVYTSSVMDLGSGVTALDSLQWTENGVQTGDGETPYSSTSLVANWKFNETSGTSATDSSGNSHTGTLTNFASTGSQDATVNSGWTANNRRWGVGALMFDGIDDYASLTRFSLTTGLSFGAWIKTTSTDSTVTYAGNAAQNIIGDTTGGVVLGFGVHGGKVRYNHYSGSWSSGSWSSVTGNISVNDGSWHYISVTHNQSTGLVSLYVDGKLDNTGTISYNASTAIDCIGRGYSADYFTGMLDAASVYSRVLGSDEILSNYQAGNIEFQTRTGNDNTPDDGGWEDWKPSGSGTETQIDNLDSNEDNTGVYDYAVVNNGANQNWAKYDNSVPSVSDTTGTNGRIPLGNSGRGDSAEVRNQTIIKDGNTYKIWYSGMDSSNIRRIYYATSPDGLTWTKYDNTIPSASNTTGTNGRIPLGNSGRGDSNGTRSPIVIKDGSTYKMWYCGSDGTNWRIYYATSSDGLTWTKYDNTIPSASNTTGTNGRIPLGTSGGDTSYALDPMVIKDGDTYKLWYSGSAGTYERIYYATSPDGLTWTKYDNTIPSASNTTGTNGRIPLGNSGRGDSDHASAPSVIKDGVVYKMWYRGNDGTNNRYYYATSFDCLTWNKYNNAVPSASNSISTDGRLPVGTAGDSNYIHQARVIKDNGIYKMWYVGQDTMPRIYYASMAPLPIGQNTDTNIKMEGTGSEKFSFGVPQADGATVGLWHLEETGGTGAYIKDSSFRANDGTPSGTTVVDGFYGKARSFNGTSDYIYTTNSFSNPQIYTISAWFNTTVASGKKIIGFEDAQTGTGSTKYDRHIWMGTDGKIRFGVWNGAVNEIVSLTTLNDGKWHNVVATQNGSAEALYVDGVLQGTQTATPNSYVGYWRIGSYGLNGDWTNASAGYFSGKIDEVSIDNIARSADEIAELYRAGRDHRLSKNLSSASDLSAKTKVPFYAAGDKLGMCVEVSVGESGFANYEPDADTVALWHLEEESGTGAYLKDSDGGNHGTPTSGTTYSSGKIGKGRMFNGTSDYITVPDSTDFTFGTGDFTVDVWVNPSVITGNYEGILGTYNTNGFMLTTSNATDGHIGWWNVTNGWIDTGVSLDLNTWQHLAVTRSSGTISIYKNGVKINSTASWTGNIDGGNLTIGRWDASYAYFNGKMDEIRISKGVAHSADDIRQAYENGKRLHPIVVDFAASLDAGNLISNSADTSFTIDATAKGLNNKGNNIFKGENILVKENYNGTEYTAQGTVTGADTSTGAISVASWSSSSTFPSGGFTANATVFKWQKEWFDVTEPLDSQIDAVNKITVRNYDGLSGKNLWLDDFEAGGPYYTDFSSSNIVSSGNQYVQYRAIFSTTDPAVTPYLSSVTTNYSGGPTNDLIMRHGKWFQNGVKQPFWWAK